MYKKKQRKEERSAKNEEREKKIEVLRIKRKTRC